MAIQLAFSTVADPGWTIQQVAQQAESIGYHGVELRTLGPGGSALASDPALSDPEKAAQIFKAHGVVPVCLSTSVCLHHRDESAATAASWQITKDLEAASRIGCRFVRVFGANVEPGENLQSVIRRIADRVAPLADKAGSLGVEILFENAGTLSTAKPWWWLMDLVDHPMIGLAWNVANAAAAGEPASVSVPMLNSRIRLAKVKDTRVGEGSGYLPLGEGTVGIEPFVKRLLGVGYDGFISFEWDRLWLPTLAPAQEALPQAHQTLTAWLEAIHDSVEKGKAAAEKAAKKNAPKPRPKPEAQTEPLAAS